MNVVLLPMWFLSGAFFPIEGAPVWLEWVMRLNPLTYGIAAMRHILYFDIPQSSVLLPSLQFCLTVLVAWSVICLMVDLWVVRGEVGA